MKSPTRGGFRGLPRSVALKNQFGISGRDRCFSSRDRYSSAPERCFSSHDRCFSSHDRCFSSHDRYFSASHPCLPINVE
ncbi:hypothetical protein H6F51_18440 [Cyanobacteria bacterium FACHB-DQ100]|nr:hypothetical protein [Cyanobacteria bacterium FACHB-DQ100]